MRLQLLKNNGLYYADVRDVRAPRVDEQSVHSMFTDDWVQVMDAPHTDDAMAQAWSRVLGTQVIRPIARKVNTRSDAARTTLPTLIEDEEFTPLVDPLSQGDTEDDRAAHLIETPGQRVASNRGQKQRTSPEKRVKGRPKVRRPVTTAEQLESELWAARLGFCGWWQLAALPGKADGIPSTFKSHPFRYIDHKEAAAIRKRPATKVATRNAQNGQRFYMDFGFLRASTATFDQPSVGTDRVVRSFDGYESYLLAVDEKSRHVWVFLTESKEPPTEMVTAFLRRYGHKDGGMIRCDQGGELARSEDFRTRVFKECDYVVEPTGADDSSQNQ